VQLQRERRPQTATTWHAWYRNELIICLGLKSWVWSS